MHQTGFKNKAGRTLYIREKIILDMQNKDIQLSDMTNEEEERGSAGPEKGLLRNSGGREKDTGESQTSWGSGKKGIARRQKKSPTLKGPGKLKRRLPTLPLVRSTIGVTKLNFSVRNGKRWNLRAIVTWISSYINDKTSNQSTAKTLNVYIIHEYQSS